MQPPRSELISIGDIEWKNAMPGVRMKTVWSDLPTMRRASMIRFEPGAKLPMHRHLGDEMVYVIEGAITDESGTVSAGNMGYRPDGCIHSVSSKNGATVLAVMTGKIEPATEIGNAPGSRILALSELPWHDGRPGVLNKPIWEDPAAKRRVALARFEPGAALPLHRHTGEELIFIIEGSHADESGEVTAASMSIRPKGCVHSVVSRNGALSLAFLWGDIEMV